MKNMVLIAAREKESLTQKQVAEKIGTTEQVYQRYEYGKQEPGVRTAIRIAKALNTTVESLFAVADDKPISKNNFKL